MLELTEFAQDLDGFLQEDVLPGIESWERARHYPIRDLIASLGRRGIFARCYLKDSDDPQRYRYNRVLHEKLAYLPGGILGSCVNNHLDAGLSLIANHGKSELAAEWRDECIRGTRLVTLASTERQTGSDIGEIRTTAVEDGDGYVLDGAKWFISNATVADGFCVLARTGPGNGVFDFTLFLVPAASAGVSVEALDTIGLRAGTLGAVRFEGVRVTKQHLVGVKGMGVPLTLKQFEKERLTLAMRLRSNSLYHLDLLRGHLQEDRLRAGGRGHPGPLAARVAEHYCELEKLRVFIDHATTMRFRGDAVAGPVAALKLQATRAAKAVAATLMQYFGDEGLAEHSVAARFWRDVKASSMSGGSDEMMLTVLGKL
ncbi:MAG: acyl-CoA dehydrogenase family protein [Pseudomonadota bacterium]